MTEKTQSFVALKQLLTDVVGELRGISDCQCVGVRLHKNGDYPYYVHEGLPEFFVLKENSLCARDESGNIIVNENGSPRLECMCGRVINGQFDPQLPYFTEKGSFWTNSTTKFLKSAQENGKLERARNMCHYSGYESVALISLRSNNRTLGLIQMNDPRQNMFTLKSVENYELLADGVGAVVDNAFVIQERMGDVFELLKKCRHT